VNFNWSLSSFEPQLAGMVNLINLSHASALAARITLTSSVASTDLTNSSVTIKEEVAPDLGLASSDFGYGTSKLIAEMLLARAAEQSGVHATIVRVGQIAGPVRRGKKGMWPMREWFPTLLATSRHLGMLPSGLGVMEAIDWVPVDVLADVLLELAGLADGAKVKVNGHAKVNGLNGVEQHHPTAGSVQVFHAINPHTIPWQTLAGSVVKYIGPPAANGKPLSAISLREWVVALRTEQADATSAAARANPGLKLLDFFESLSRSEILGEDESGSEGTQGGHDAEEGRSASQLQTTKAIAKSPTLSALSPVGEEWMKMWIAQWGF
jgi:thioester reductase-like protein